MRLSCCMYMTKKMLTHALQDLEQAVREPFLLQQFLAGIPEAISKQLRALGEVTTYIECSNHMSEIVNDN